MRQEMKGLSEDEAARRQQQYGKNILIPEKKTGFFLRFLNVLKEPMFLLLLIAACIYFILGEPGDGAIMLLSVVGIIMIELVQEWKTERTLQALKSLAAPQVEVYREGVRKNISSEDLVPGDIMLLEEGMLVPADAKLISCSDLCTDESTLTGEPIDNWKQTEPDRTDSYWKCDYCYAGTVIRQGTGIGVVTSIGTETYYGRMCKNVMETKKSTALLQQQIRKLVRICAILSIILFVLVSFITYFNISNHNFADRIIESILAGITLAMAMIPEEFPVVLTVFLSMGAWRLAKQHSLIRRLISVETLGSISVLCVDKTGTITKNEMEVTQVYGCRHSIGEVLTMMERACEEEAYDPMEKAMISFCYENGVVNKYRMKETLEKEYSFTNALKMMGHVWRKEDGRLLAAKGAPERIFSICNWDQELRAKMEEKMKEMSMHGLRVIAVAGYSFSEEESLKEELSDYALEFYGLVGLTDPPREDIRQDIKECQKAGVRVIMVTGDNGTTARAIAKEVGMNHCDDIVSGNMLEEMSEEELGRRIGNCNIFSRVIPKHKLRIVKRLQERGEVVAMTGDGVNDAPALKCADIGIAMGKRGSEVAREASDLILMDDNFSTIVHSIRDGRRIYDNIKKAVGYIFAIHIPIAASCLLAPLLGISPDNLFLLPIHIVLLELMIDPTCSIVLERQPEEKNIMDRKPRSKKESIVTVPLLCKSVLQGGVIFGAAFYNYYSLHPDDAAKGRTIGLVIIILANFFLVQVNSSKEEYALWSMRKLIKDNVMWAVSLIMIAFMGIVLYTPLNGFLKLVPLSGMELLKSLGYAFAAVFWFEIVKLIKKKLCKV